MRYKLILFAFCICYCRVSFGQQWLWAKSDFSEPTYFNAQSAYLNGNIVTGFSNKVSSYSTNGILSWSVSVNGLSIKGLCTFNNEIFITGTFTGSVNFGTQTILSNGMKDVFIAKYSSAGVCQWATSFGESQDDISNGICVDNSGGLAITGEFRNTMVVGADTLTSTNPMQSFFVSKFNVAGQFLWTKQSDGWGSGVSVKPDGSGAIYALGTFGQQTTFDNTTVNGASYGNSFILVKYSNTGSVVWAKLLGSSSTSAMNMMGNHVGGNILIGLNGGPISSLYKIDPNGNLLWTKAIGYSNYGMNVYGVWEDVSGDIYTTGSFAFQGSFCPGNLPGGLFLCRWDSGGNCQWTANAVSSNGIEGKSIIMGADGALYLSGYFNDTASIGANSFPRQQPYNFFLSKIDKSLATDIKKNDNTETLIHIYPNPCTEELTLQFNGFVSQKDIKVWNSLGEIIYKGRYTPSSVSDLEKISVKNYKPGIYFLSVEETGSVEVKKFVVE